MASVAWMQAQQTHSLTNWRCAAVSHWVLRRSMKDLVYCCMPRQTLLCCTIVSFYVQKGCWTDKHIGRTIYHSSTGWPSTKISPSWNSHRPSASRKNRLFSSIRCSLAGTFCPSCPTTRYQACPNIVKTHGVSRSVRHKFKSSRPLVCAVLSSRVLL